MLGQGRNKLSLSNSVIMIKLTKISFLKVTNHESNLTQVEHL